MNVYLNTNRNGYAPEQCGRTLTVQELIDVLQALDPDANVYFSNDNGYTFGSIWYENIVEGDEDAEDDYYEEGGH